MPMLYYSEYLARISSVSLCICSSDSVTSIETSHDRIFVTSGAKITTLQLPLPLTKLYIKPDQREVSLRIPCATKSTLKHNWNFIVPWQAPNLMGKSLTCRQCAQPLITISKIQQLPSEYWAELMEFWHCHKPHDSHDHTKDYNISFDPVAGKPLVGDAYMRFYPEDVNACEHIDPDKTWKWQVAVDNVLIDAHVFIAAILRELVNSHAIFSFFIESPNYDTLIWIFNIEAEYLMTDRKLSKGLKVYFSTNSEQYTALKESRGEIESVSLPDVALKELIMELDKTNKLLPPQARKLGDWNLGFIGDS